MTLNITLQPLPSGQRVRVILHGESEGEILNKFQDVSTNLMYEAITEITNNALRQMVSKLERRLKVIREEKTKG